MALVNCPECGKEISDKSKACIHCGFPLEDTEPKESINGIVRLFEGYAANSLSIGDVSNIFSDIMQEVYNIKQSHSEQEAADLIAKGVIDGLILIPSKLSWMNGKQYCEIINYKALSAEGMDYFTNQLYSVLSIKKYYDDGSGGLIYITPFFYATYMVLQYGSESNKSKLLTILRTSYCGSKQSWYDHVVSMFRQHGGGNTVQQIAAVQISLHSSQGTQSIKCPVCGSIRVNKISTANRLTSVFAFGLASSKIGKQYECKNCKHKW